MIAATLIFFILAILAILYALLFRNDYGDYSGFLYLIAGSVFFVCGIVITLIIWLS